MVWRIELSGKAAKQLAKLYKVAPTRITTFLRQRLATLADPRSTREALTGPTFGVYWRYRVSDYRIICDIQDGRLCVLVIEIGNRREVYR